MTRKLIGLLTLITVIGMSASVNAEIIFEISPSTSSISAGSNGTLTFLVSTDTAAEGDLDLGSFDMGVRVSAFGGSNLGDLTLAGPVGLDGHTASLDLTTFAPDSLYQGFRGAAAIGASTNLFSVDFSINAGATEAGGFNFDVVSLNGNDPVLNIGSANQINPSFDGVEGSLAFSAVPEPSSLMVLAGAAAFIFSRRRRL
jgi:hypothetical protein